MTPGQERRDRPDTRGYPASGESETAGARLRSRAALLSREWCARGAPNRTGESMKKLAGIAATNGQEETAPRVARVVQDGALEDRGVGNAYVIPIQVDQDRCRPFERSRLVVVQMDICVSIMSTPPVTSITMPTDRTPTRTICVIIAVRPSRTLRSTAARMSQVRTSKMRYATPPTSSKVRF